jgi:hypothetical protein
MRIARRVCDSAETPQRERERVWNEFEYLILTGTNDFLHVCHPTYSTTSLCTTGSPDLGRVQGTSVSVRGLSGAFPGP